jgi:hypothetical protein
MFGSISSHMSHVACQSITPSVFWGLVWCYTEGPHQSEGCHVHDQWPTPPQPPSHRQWTHSARCALFTSFCVACRAACGSSRYTEVVLDNRVQHVYIVCVANCHETCSTCICKYFNQQMHVLFSYFCSINPTYVSAPTLPSSGVNW